MPAQSGNNRNKLNIKRLCLYGIFTALCLVFGYIESLVPLAFIAPGIKLGLSNAVVLMLAIKGDIKGAFAVNITRILLSALLFGSAMSLIFALSGGIMSLTATCLLKKLKGIGILGLSIAGGTVHNIFQAAAAAFIIGKGVLYYLPVLLIGGALSGALISVICMPMLKAFERNI